MAQNTAIWDALKKTDPKHTKPFQRSGGFRGTAIKPMYATLKMTEQFGACGFGWGMGKPEFTTMAVADEILVYCTVMLWYEGPDGRGEVYGVGGDKVATKRKDGGVATDDEAFKKSYTDALSNAMKQLGVGADVHMGQFEDSKYVRELEREFSEQAAPASRPTAPAVKSGPAMSDEEADTLCALVKETLPLALTTDDLTAAWRDNAERIKALPQERRDMVTRWFADRKAEILTPANAAE